MRFFTSALSLHIRSAVRKTGFYSRPGHTKNFKNEIGNFIARHSAQALSVCMLFVLHLQPTIGIRSFIIDVYNKIDLILGLAHGTQCVLVQLKASSVLQLCVVTKILTLGSCNDRKFVQNHSKFKHYFVFTCIELHISPPSRESYQSAITSSLRSDRLPVYHTKIGKSR